MRAGNIFINDLRDLGILERVRIVSCHVPQLISRFAVLGEDGEDNIVRVQQILPVMSPI